MPIPGADCFGFFGANGGFVNQPVSIDMASADYFQKTGSNVLGYTSTNGFSFMFVVKQTTALDLGRIVDFKAAANHNLVQIVSKAGATSCEVLLRGSDAVVHQRKTWNSIFADATWVVVVVTMDAGGGTDLKFYKNGADQGVADTVTTNTALTVTDPGRAITLGSQLAGSQGLQGRFHSFAIWDTELGALEPAAIFNGGDVGEFNLAEDSGNYTNSESLVRWYRFGLESGDIGKDFVSEDLDVMDNAVGIAAGDIVSDAPSS